MFFYFYLPSVPVSYGGTLMSKVGILLYNVYKFDSFLLKNSWQFIGTIGVVVLIICSKRVIQETEIVPTIRL